MSLIQVASSSGNLSAGQTRSKALVAVEVCEHWGDAWQRVNYLEPISHTDIVAPQIGTASFLYHYGRIKREDRASFSSYNEIDLNDWYVRVVDLRTSAINWTGVIVTDFLTPYGGSDGAGVQRIEAFSLCHELDREQIRSVLAKDGTGAIIEIEDVPDVNQKYKRGVELFGNVSLEPHTDGAVVFSSEGEVCTARMLCEMLLARHTPENGPTFALAGEVSVLENIRDIWKIKGKTPWDIITKIISRDRGLALSEIVSGDTVQLYVSTILETDVSVGGVVVPANSHQVQINLDQSLDIKDSTQIVRSTSFKFDRIEVRGKKSILACFTVGYLDGTVEEGWTDESRIEYDLADSVRPAHASLSNADKELFNDDFRNSDAVSAVFVKHRIPRDWDKQVGTGDGGTKAYALPVCDDNGQVSVGPDTPFFPMGKHFETWLPFEEGVDYSVSPAVAVGQLDDAEPSFVPPFALVENPDFAGEWIYCNKGTDEIPGSAADFAVYPREMAFGVEAKPRHLYGLGYFDPDAAALTATDPELEYDTIMATVAMRTDQVLKVVATRSGLASGERIRTKLIEVDGAEYWYAVPGTVIGVNHDKTLKRYAGNGVLRDDSYRLREIAAFALAWYGRDRRAITLDVTRIEMLAPLGSLVVGTVTAGTFLSIGTIVSSRTCTYGEEPNTKLQTEWAEIDFSGGITD